MTSALMSKAALSNSAHAANILVVEDDEFAMQNILLGLEDLDARIRTASTATKAMKILDSQYFNLLITDVKLPGSDGISLVDYCRTRHPATKYIVITGYADEKSVIRALRLGVNEFLKKPYRDKELLAAVRNLLDIQEKEDKDRAYAERIQRENEVLRVELERRDKSGPESLIIGNSELVQKCMSQADKVAQFGVNALIRGESGSGKEMFAQYVHRAGERKHKPLVPVNCAALTPQLFESELFGYEKGAFTGAVEAKAGLFEVADGGILFLDEVTEIPLSLQAKLLRVVETQTVRRVGSSKLKQIDVQILSASNRSMVESIREGSFREDLYHRLATTEIVLPALRERMEDFDLLLQHFIKLSEKQFNVPFPPLGSEMLTFLKAQRWEGNVRQLSNFVKKWFLFGESATREDVVQWLNISARSPVNENVQPLLRYDFVNGTVHELNEAKEMLVRKVLSIYKGNKSKTARHLGLSYPGLLKMLKAFLDRRRGNSASA